MLLPLDWFGSRPQLPGQQAVLNCKVPGDTVGWNPWLALLSWRLEWGCAGGEEARRA